MKSTAQNFFKCSTILFAICSILFLPSAFANEKPAVFYHAGASGESTSSMMDSTTEFESKIISEDNKKARIAVRFPKIISLSIPESRREGVNAAIKKFVDRLSQEDIRIFTEDGLDVEVDNYIGELKNEIDVKFEIINLDSHFVSIKFTKYFYKGGAAHGVSALYGFNYSVDTQSIVKLSELFETNSNYLVQISALVTQDLKRQVRAELKGDPENLTDLEDWVKRGTEPTEENFMEFAFNGSFLTIYFGQYQVGPGAFGVRESKIWTGDLKGLKDGKVRPSTSLS